MTLLYTAVIRLRRIPSPNPTTVTDPTEGYTKVTESSAENFDTYFVLVDGVMTKATGEYDANAEYYTMSTGATMSTPTLIEEEEGGL